MSYYCCLCRYGVYTTALRVLVPDDSVMSFQLLFGYIGLFNAAALLPVLIILIFAAPAVFAGFSASVLGFIVLNGLCDNVLRCDPPSPITHHRPTLAPLPHPRPCAE